MQIRLMEYSELEDVMQLWRTTSAATYTFLNAAHTENEDRAYFRNHIAAQNTLWVAVDRGELLGFLAINGSYIDRLYIHPDRQRRGVGAALINHAKELSPHGLELHTHVKNANACAFYEKNGFFAAKYGVSPPPESEPDVEYHWRSA